jgi:long-chain acyl-CoA synthetase
MYQFSSGSTGRPKRIARTHAQLLAELESLTGALDLSPADRFLGVAPFSHVNGLMRTMMASIHAGATLYPLPRFERQAAVSLIEDHRVSVLIAVPFVFAMLAKGHVLRRRDLSSLRLCVSASAPFPAALNTAFRDRFGMHVRQLYGSTETGTISVNLLADVSRTLESVGRPLPGVEVEVRAGDGRVAAAGEAAAGEVGEFAVKSRFAITAYDGGAPIGIEEPFRDGYFLTGDLGKRDTDGLLYLVGRKNLLINRGGYKVNPREIEEVLESHPKVDEAVALGVPTPYGDQRIRAVIVTNAKCTEEELVEYCRGKIASFKVPSIIEIRDSLPKSATGKVRRDALRDGIDA